MFKKSNTRDGEKPKNALDFLSFAREHRTIHKKLQFLVLSLFILFFLFTSMVFASQQKVMQAKLFLTLEIEIKDVLKLHLDIVKLKPKQYAEIVTDREEVEELKKLGYQV